jgi:hypothetical protein
MKLILKRITFFYSFMQISKCHKKKFRIENYFENLSYKLKVLIRTDTLKSDQFADISKKDSFI